MKPRILCEYKGGSHSYGLATPTSDIDLRGVYIVETLANIIDPHSYSATKCDVLNTNPERDKEDKVYYEVRHFLHLLKKGNSQSIEMLFNNNWTKLSPLFAEIIRQKHKLLNPEKINLCINGYANSEYHLAIGDRTGKLGGKRQSQVEKYGFSPKNFTNLFRLLYCASTFYETGIFPVDLTGSYIHPQLKEIKCNPERFTIARLNEMYKEHREVHDESWEKNKEDITHAFEFDESIATELMFQCYKDSLITLGRIGIIDEIKNLFRKSL